MGEKGQSNKFIALPFFLHVALCFPAFTN